MLARLRGISLLEIIVAMVIATLLLGAGVPTFQNLVLNASRRAALNSLVASVHLARSAAIRRNAVVVICALDETQRCDTADDWQTGWVVFVNLDRDFPPVLDGDEPVLYRQAAPRRIQVNSNRNAFLFQRIGLRATNGTITFCDRRGARAARAVIISYTGRPRIAQTRADGADLVCL